MHNEKASPIDRLEVLPEEPARPTSDVGRQSRAVKSAGESQVLALLLTLGERDALRRGTLQLLETRRILERLGLEVGDGDHFIRAGREPRDAERAVGGGPHEPHAT